MSGLDDGYHEKPTDVSDFEQSDEYAYKYEEEQKAKKLLAATSYQGKFGRWWKNHRTLRIRAMRVAVFLYVIFIFGNALLHAIRTYDNYALVAFFTIGVTVLTIILTVVVLAALAGIVWSFLWIFKPTDK